MCCCLIVQDKKVILIKIFIEFSVTIVYNYFDSFIGGIEMRISVNAGFFLGGKYDNQTYEDVFSCLVNNSIKDIDYITDAYADDYIERARACREIADKTGIVITQSHCPMGRYKRDLSFEDVIPTSIRSVEIAGILGAKFLVVHADEYRFAPGEEYNPEKVIRVMYEYVSEILEKAKPYGIKVCIENLFEDNRYPDMKRSRFTSTIEELLEIVNMFDREDVGICWDFGHSLCAFGEESTEKFKLALPYVECLHVHDNMGKSDAHSLPFNGINDWETQMKLLKQAGYKGTLNYELGHGRVPDGYRNIFAEHLYKVGRYLISLQED